MSHTTAVWVWGVTFFTTWLCLAWLAFQDWRMVALCAALGLIPALTYL